MTRNTLNATFFSLLSIFAVACGDAGGAGVDDTELGDVFAGEEEANDNEDPNVEQGDEEPTADAGDEDVDDDEGVIDEDPIEPEEEEPAAFEATGQISISVIIDSLISNEAPAEDSCSGNIAMAVEDGKLLGEGRCFLDNNDNFLDYDLDADLDENGVVDGEIDVLLNGRSNVVRIEGTLDNGVLSLEFAGVTLVTANIRAVWDGAIVAEAG